MSALSKRLLQVKGRAKFTVSDMGRYFSVCRETMDKWLRGATPSEYRIAEINERLEALEFAITDGVFPMPWNINQYGRREYVEDVRDGKIGAVSKPRPAIGGIKVSGGVRGKRGAS